MVFVAATGEKYLGVVPRDAGWERRAAAIDKKFEPSPKAVAAAGPVEVCFFRYFFCCYLRVLPTGC